MKQVKRVFKTDSDTILIVTASTEGTGKGNNYVSVTANEIQPILRSDAVRQVREDLEDGELWKMAVAAGSTEQGLEDWVNWVIQTDGELSGFDNSLYDSEIEIDGDAYIFDSRSCGCMHKDIKAVTKDFDKLIALHLKSDKKSLKAAETLILALQKSEDTDIDFQVEKFTREILGIEA